MINKLVYWMLIGLAGSCLSCQKDESPTATGKLFLAFLHQVDGQPLVLTEKVYTNAAGNAYRIEKLKYYVSNIELTRADGKVYAIPDGYYLVEEAGLNTRTSIELPAIPAATYAALSFAIGVDSARNFSTEMVGELNPNNDMAWNWVSGYKFFLLEGKFTTSSQATGAIVYHIGGNRSLRRVRLSAPAGGINITGNRTLEAGIGADISRVFDSKTTINLNTSNAVMEPGSEADQIADNYSGGMFQLHHIQVK